MSTKETQAIIDDLRMVLDGQPWFGRPLYSILDGIHPAVVFKRPNEEGHSLIDLLYHMITWADFTLKRLKGEPSSKEEEETMDWRQIDPLEHTWAKGLVELRNIHEQIIDDLSKRDDEFLDKNVEGRDYTFRFMLKGLVQHDIYHLGQIAYLTKWLIPA
jgi:uncharacterized damage-inducible protein DinB